MLTDGMLALAALAGNTVVVAATTDAWEATRRRFAKLLGCGDPQQEQLAERRLDETRKRLSGAKNSELEQASSVLADQWAVRLADLLEEDPGARANLRSLVDEIQMMLPTAAVSAAGHSVSVGRDVSVNAAPGSVAAAVINVNMGPPGPTVPGPVTT